MKAENLPTLAAASIRMNVKTTVLPSLVLLLVIPFLCGTANLDPGQSADCLERMAALIGIPIFTSLARWESSRGLFEITALRPVSFRFMISLRAGLSAAETFGLVLGFASFMKSRGCSFPLLDYSFRTLAAAMALGLAGLLIASAAKNTAAGFLGAFCFYFLLQTESLPGMFYPVANGISFSLAAFLAGTGAAILSLCRPAVR